MKTRFSTCSGGFCLGIICAAAAVLHAAPTQTKPKADSSSEGRTNDIPQSVFVIPDTPEEGRDPFFPNSSHAGTPGPKPSASAGADALVLNGIGGTPDHKLAMINGRTMAEGETNEVNTAAGRVRIRCLEIKGESALIEVIGGERRELHLRN